MIEGMRTQKNKVVVKRSARGKKAHIVLTVDVSWQKGDDLARDRACAAIGRLFGELMTAEEKARFLKDLAAAARTL